MQYALNCFQDAGSCNGGWYMPIFNHMISQGTVAESALPTTCHIGACPHIPHPYRAASWGFVGNSRNIPSSVQIKEALCAHGPLATAVMVDGPFQAYTGGVFDERFQHFQGINHAITIMGWDDEKIGLDGNRGAWLIKNSWGTGWGATGDFGSSKGYMWISYNTNNIGFATGVNAANLKYGSPSEGIGTLQVDTLKQLSLEPLPTAAVGSGWRYSGDPAGACCSLVAEMGSFNAQCSGPPGSFQVQ